jgi:phosphoribosylformylglycinamidine synthase
VAVTGARPWALTDCLNFGHPEDPAVMADLEDTIAGLAEAARALGGLASPGQALPFVSGNVSLYNQVGRQAIPPSPIVMCAGVIHDVGRALGLGVRDSGHVLVLAGEDRDGLEGSVYRREVLREQGGPPPALDLAREARLQDLAVAIAEGGWAVAAHDVSKGGLAVALTEMLLGAPDDRPLGADVDLEAFEVDAVVALFCERPAIVYEVPFQRLARLSQAARDRGFVAWPIGTVSTQPRLRVRAPGGTALEWDVAALREASEQALARLWNEEGV